MYFSDQTPEARQLREARARADTMPWPAIPRPIELAEDQARRSPYIHARATPRPVLRPAYPAASPGQGQGQALALAVCLAALIIGVMFFSVAIHSIGIFGQ